MQRNKFPSAADLIFVVAAPLTAIMGAVKLTQADGDLSAHIRMGRVILATGNIPTHSLASYTAATEPMVGHAELIWHYDRPTWLYPLFETKMNKPLKKEFASLVSFYYKDRAWHFDVTVPKTEAE